MLGCLKLHKLSWSGSRRFASLVNSLYYVPRDMDLNPNLSRIASKARLVSESVLECESKRDNCVALWSKPVTDIPIKRIDSFLSRIAVSKSA